MTQFNRVRTLLVSLILVILMTSLHAPTAVHAQGLTPAEKVYATTIGDHAATVCEALTEIGKLMENPLIGNDEWTLDMAVQLAAIRVLYDEAMEMDAPSSMANIHLKYVQAMKHFEAATHLIADGIDELAPGLMD